MPFIGNQPADKFLTLEKQVFTTSATDTYTLDREVSSVNDIELFLNNVRQEPTEAYTISGTTLTLASAITSSDSLYCVYQGRAVGTQSPANGSVTNAMLSSGSFSNITGTGTLTNFTSTGIDDNADATAITIDSSENVGIGTSSPTFNNGTGLHLNSATTDCRFHITNSATGSTASDGAYIVSGGTGDMLVINMENSDMLFYTNALERMRIANSGKLMINTTSDLGNSQGVLHVKGKSVSNIARFGAGSNGEEVVFVNASNSQVGSIAVNASSTSYNTSSDHRLKENVIDLDDATTRVKQLQPKRFNFISEPDTTIDGFLAHEVSSIIPEAVKGTHNEVEVWKEGEELPEGVSVGDNKLDYEGNTIPKYQGIDQSKLVPLLTASLKEAIAKIEELETRIATLENA